VATLVWPLAVGFSDAASGTAEFYTRGTSTISTLVYSDPDAQTAVTTHALSASGRLNRYVTERVDLVVKNAAGAPVATIPDVCGVDGRTVRLESTAFTGSNPNGNGQTIAGGIRTLHSGWSLYRESQGADDGYVNINGTEYTLKNALASAGSVFFNVKTGYGATGNGTTDDTSAIQSAINAAQNAGGGVVFFPSGTYKLTGSLTVTGSIQLLGAGVNTTSLSQATSGLTGPWLSISASFVTVSNLRITASAATTGSAIGFAAGSNATNLYVEQCRFGSHAGACFTNSDSGGSSTTRATFTSCRFDVETTAGIWITHANGLGIVQLVGCSLFATVVPTNALIIGAVTLVSNSALFFGSTSGGVILQGTITGGARLILNGCSILSGNTSGTNSLGSAATVDLIAISGCYIIASAGGTLNMAVSGAGSAQVQEAGSLFHTTGTVAWPAGFQTTGASLSRDRRKSENLALSGTTYTPDVDFGLHRVVHSSGASMAFGNPTNVNHRFGSPLVISYANNTGGAITPTWGTSYSGVPATAVNNGTRALYVFICDESDEWVCVTATPVIGYT
jgi:Pectate lyase superfamily protein